MNDSSDVSVKWTCVHTISTILNVGWRDFRSSQNLFQRSCLTQRRPLCYSWRHPAFYWPLPYIGHQDGKKTPWTFSNYLQTTTEYNIFWTWQWKSVTTFVRRMCTGAASRRSCWRSLTSLETYRWLYIWRSHLTNVVQRNLTWRQ